MWYNLKFQVNFTLFQDDIITVKYQKIDHLDLKKNFFHFPLGIMDLVLLKRMFMYSGGGGGGE